MHGIPKNRQLDSSWNQTVVAAGTLAAFGCDWVSSGLLRPCNDHPAITMRFASKDSKTPCSCNVQEQTKHIEAAIAVRTTPSLGRTQPAPAGHTGYLLPFIAGCNHFTRKNTRFRAPASRPKRSPCNTDCTAICNQRVNKRIESRTHEQTTLCRTRDIDFHTILHWYSLTSHKSNSYVM